MPYTVKEIYYTLQGEGARAGRAAVLCRFAGCNLWSGREEDRAGAACSFCDTDFVGTDGPGGGRFATPAELAAALSRAWRDGPADAVATFVDGSAARGARESGRSTPGSTPNAATREGRRDGRPYVVFTGGEPGLQLDGELVGACHDAGFEVAVETNGTVPLPAGIDWVTVSPKPGPPLVVRRGNELKLVHPQAAVPPESVADLDFEEFYLQPMDGPDRARNVALATEYCLRHPRWRLSLQTHKLAGLR